MRIAFAHGIGGARVPVGFSVGSLEGSACGSERGTLPRRVRSKLGRRGFGSALLFALLVLGATSRAATQATDGIILESPRVDPGRALNCTKNEKVYEVASLLIRERVPVRRRAATRCGGRRTDSPQRICELQGVICLRNCSVFSKEDCWRRCNDIGTILVSAHLRERQVWQR